MAVALFVTACSAAGPAGSLPRVGSATEDEHPPSLVGAASSLVSIDGGPAPVGTAVTITFGPQSLSGDGPCNGYGGDYTYDPRTGELRIASLISTKRACLDPARNAYESDLFQALRGRLLATVQANGGLLLRRPGVQLLWAAEP